MVWSLPASRTGWQRVRLHGVGANRLVSGPDRRWEWAL